MGSWEWERGRQPHPLLPIRYSLLPTAIANIERNHLNVGKDPPLARGHQEAALLLHRRRPRHLAARRALYRADRHPQPAAAEGQRRSRETRPRAGEVLALRRRAA